MPDGYADIIRGISQSFIDEFSYLPLDRLNYKPDENVWSILECTDHIIQSNKQYFPIFDQLAADEYKVPFAGRIPLLPDLFGKMILQGVKPETQRKSKTFPIFAPRSSQYSTSILSEIKPHNEELISHIAQTAHINRKQVIASPVNKIITYRLGVLIEILVEHEKRHLQQAIRVRERIL